MARLLADENFDHRIVRALRGLGHDILTLPMPGACEAGTADSEVLTTVLQLGRGVLTHDRQDYIRLHRRGGNHSGVIVVSPDPDTQAVALRIHAAIGEQDALAGLLLRVNLLPHPQREPTQG